MLQLNLEVRDNYIYCQPSGEIILGNSLHFLRQLLNECHDKRINKLLINISQLSANKLSNSQQFLLAAQVSSFWDKRVKVAIVGLGPDVSPLEFSLLVLKNRGVTLEAFTYEADGSRWLLSEPRPKVFTQSQPSSPVFSLSS
jgi:hypothetical protein